MIEQYKSIIFGILSDKPIAYHPDIAKMLKSTTACIFLSQLLYWSGRGHSGEWIYKTQDEWYEETGLSRREQETARKKLRDFGILREVRRGQPSRLFYSIDFERLSDCLAEYYRKPGETGPHEPNSPNMRPDSEHSSMAESANLECTNPPDKNGGMRHSIYTENTTENTTYVVVVEPPAGKNRKPQRPFQSKVSENQKVIASSLKGKNSTDFSLKGNIGSEPLLRKNSVGSKKVHESENTKILLQLQQQAEKICGVRLTLDVLGELVEKFGQEKVKEKINMFGSVQTKNAPGFLIAALRDDYTFTPGRPPRQQQQRASPGSQTVRKSTQTRAREPDTAEALERKKMIQSLYLS